MDAPHDWCPQISASTNGKWNTKVHLHVVIAVHTNTTTVVSRKEQAQKQEGSCPTVRTSLRKEVIINESRWTHTYQPKPEDKTTNVTIPHLFKYIHLKFPQLEEFLNRKELLGLCRVAGDAFKSLVLPFKQPVAALLWHTLLLFYYYCFHCPPFLIFLIRQQPNVKPVHGSTTTVEREKRMETMETMCLIVLPDEHRQVMFS